MAFIGNANKMNSKKELNKWNNSDWNLLCVVSSFSFSSQKMNAVITHFNHWFGCKFHPFSSLTLRVYFSPELEGKQSSKCRALVEIWFALIHRHENWIDLTLTIRLLSQTFIFIQNDGTQTLLAICIFIFRQFAKKNRK